MEGKPSMTMTEKPDQGEKCAIVEEASRTAWKEPEKLNHRKRFWEWSIVGVAGKRFLARGTFHLSGRPAAGRHFSGKFSLTHKSQANKPRILDEASSAHSAAGPASAQLF